jgi:hypothetical protein
MLASCVAFRATPLDDELARPPLGEHGALARLVEATVESKASASMAVSAGAMLESGGVVRAAPVPTAAGAPPKAAESA